MERWRKPPVILASEPDGRGTSGQVIETSDGRLQVDPLLTVDAETADRLRQGYLCANCLEPFERPWPEHCPVCGVPVRREQGLHYAAQFRGIEIRRQRSVDEEIDAIHDDLARKEEAH